MFFFNHRLNGLLMLFWMFFCFFCFTPFSNCNWHGKNYEGWKKEKKRNIDASESRKIETRIGWLNSQFIYSVTLLKVML